jgi:hypothetical protein
MNTAAADTEARILTIIHKRGSILLEQLPSYLPDLTWNQVFLGVDELSRQDAISLRRRGCDYELRERSPDSQTNRSRAIVRSAPSHVPPLVPVPSAS